MSAAVADRVDVAVPRADAASTLADVRPRGPRRGVGRAGPLAGRGGGSGGAGGGGGGAGGGGGGGGVLSAPWTVVSTGAELVANGKLGAHLGVSLTRAALGLAAGIVAGVVLALAAGLSRVGDAVLDGPIQVKRAIPNLALLPLLILWFGIGEEMKVITIALGVFIPIYLHTHNGLRAIDSRYVELAETVQLSRWQFVRRVILPGALPGFFLGLRFAVTGSMLALVVVEQVNATAGIGYMMELARTYGQTEIILVGLVVYGVLGYSADLAVRLLQRRVLSWRRTLED